MLNKYEVPIGVCGADLCPEPDMDCWKCTLRCIEEHGFEATCECGSDLCAICNLKNYFNQNKKVLDKHI